MLDKIITYSFYLLFFLTPLFWTSLNYELFEFNKMLLTYSFTIIIVGCWLLKIINHKSLIFNRTPLDLPLLLFLGANILSTIFSMDKHISIWGYYSRQNGGLLSLVSYLALYWAFVSNITPERIKTLLKFALASGLIVSVWGILEHFGASPSCMILRGQISSDCWIQDVAARVFATLGQPNWMASYLAMLIFPAFYFFLTAKKNLEFGTWYLVLIVYYLAFTFTYSRGPTLGLGAGLVVFLLITLRSHMSSGKLVVKPLLLVLGSFLFINLLFGSALTNFRLVSKFAPPPRPSITLPASNVTQLENGGTESGHIRFIVWQGALDIFKHNPIFGSGLETFALSYYQFRPPSHNLTSEWDFLYNKAHNEYLNYLSTTGLVGFGTYMIVILTFVIWCLRNLKFEIFNLNVFQTASGRTNFKLKIKNYKQNNPGINLLVISLLAAYISYLIYNFFLFSVVIIAIFFYLFPAIAFVASESTSPLKIPKKLYPIPYTLYPILFRRPFYTNVAKVFVIFVICYLLFGISKLWYADLAFAKGQRASELGNPGRAYNLLSDALRLKSSEPLYQSELAYAAASAALALKDEDATLSSELKEQAVFEMERVLRENPKNISYLRTAVRVYFELASLDKKYTDKTLEVLDKAINLAPTDPKLYYNKALILEFMDKKVEAVESLQKAYDLKPNYLEVKSALEEATKSAK